MCVLASLGVDFGYDGSDASRFDVRVPRDRNDARIASIAGRIGERSASHYDDGSDQVEAWIGDQTQRKSAAR